MRVINFELGVVKIFVVGLGVLFKSTRLLVGEDTGFVLLCLETVCTVTSSSTSIASAGDRHSDCRGNGRDIPE